MTPTLGRIVHYTLTETDAESVNASRTTHDDVAARIEAGPSHWPQGAQPAIGVRVSAGQKFPMVIVAVNGDDVCGENVSGQVFLDGTDQLYVRSAFEGEGEGDFQWPAIRPVGTIAPAPIAAAPTNDTAAPAKAPIAEDAAAPEKETVVEQAAANNAVATETGDAKVQ